MTRKAGIIVLLLGLALVVTTLGWIRSTDSIHLAEDAPSRFDSCTFNSGLLVLRYTYGANEEVAPTVDTRHKDKLVVELDVETGDGITAAVGLAGRAEFSIHGSDPDTRIEYTDGRRLHCDRPAAGR